MLIVEVLCCVLQAAVSAKEIAKAREEIATAQAFVSILSSVTCYIQLFKKVN